jgi:hypothetical protein
MDPTAMVRASTARVVAQSKHVHIDDAAVARLAEKLVRMLAIFSSHTNHCSQIELTHGRVVVFPRAQSSNPTSKAS